MLIACKSMAKAVNLKKQLNTAFDMTNLGSASKILGMTIERDKHRKTLKITQKTYLEKLVDKFGMKDAKLTRIPLAGHFKLLVNLKPVKEEERRYMERVPYSSAVGSIMFSMETSRPDLSYAISVLSRFMSDPKKEHWEAMKWLIKYIKGSTNLGLIYKKDGNKIWLDGYTDANYVGDRYRRRSLCMLEISASTHCCSFNHRGRIYNIYRGN